MARTVAIGIQDFEQIRKNNCFYVDKTDFIREWWESMDVVTLTARPRRFGKMLNMSMLEEFFRLVCMDMPEYVATVALHKLSDFMCRFYGKKVIILLDEYDTSMQES